MTIRYQNLTAALLITALSGFTAAGWAGDMKSEKGMMSGDKMGEHKGMAMKDDGMMKQKEMAMEPMEGEKGMMSDDKMGQHKGMAMKDDGMMEKKEMAMEPMKGEKMMEKKAMDDTMKEKM